MKISMLTAAMLSPVLALSASAASAAEPGWPAHALGDVPAVVRALNAGAHVHAAVDLTVCTPVGSSPAAVTAGGLDVNPYRVVNGTLSFSDAHFTVSTSGSAQPIMQFLRYTVTPDSAVKVESYLYDVPAYTLISQVSYTCAIGQGVNFTAAP